MIKALLIYLFIMAVLTFIYHFEGFNKETIRGLRESQAFSLNRNNFIVKNLEKGIEKKIKPSKRIKVEEMVQQAGLNISYGEYFILSLLSASLMAMIFGFSMNNVILGIIIGALGFFIPHQAIAYVKNKRLKLMEAQIGSFMKMIIARYKKNKDFTACLRLVEREFQGAEPIHSEIIKTIVEIDSSVSTEEAIENLGKRTGNKYMKRFAAYYKITASIGTETARTNVLDQAFKQFDEDYQLKRELKREIAGPVQEAYIMVAAVPGFAIQQAMTNPDYIDIMTTTTIGKIGTAAILGVLILIVWFINAKLGAPLE